MKVKIELSNIIWKHKQEIFIDDYDHKYFPPKPKGELTFNKMFEYWSKRMSEQNIFYPPEYFDLTKNVGIMFKITEVTNKEWITSGCKRNTNSKQNIVKLAIKIWEKHIEVFDHFDLVCHNGTSLEEETRSNALFNALVTLHAMHKWNNFKQDEIQQSIDYLRGSKYYSEKNQNSTY